MTRKQKEAARRRRQHKMRQKAPQLLMLAKIRAPHDTWLQQYIERWERNGPWTVYMVEGIRKQIAASAMVPEILKRAV